MAIRRAYGRGEVDEEEAQRAFSDNSELGGKVGGEVFCNCTPSSLPLGYQTTFHTKLNSSRLTAPIIFHYDTSVELEHCALKVSQ